jgi:hypothetical protein
MILAVVSIALGFGSHARSDVCAKGADGPERITKITVKNNTPSMIRGSGK